jgi:hypothetical protein
MGELLPAGSTPIPTPALPLKGRESLLRMISINQVKEYGQQSRHPQQRVPLFLCGVRRRVDCYIYLIIVKNGWLRAWEEWWVKTKVG